MQVDKIIEEANKIAEKYNLKLLEIDRTDNIISLKLSIDKDLFIQIYGNVESNKLNLALSLKTGAYTDMTMKVVVTTVILLPILRVI